MGDEIRSGLVQLLPRLRRFGIMLTGSSVDADDLVQNACARVLNRRGQLRDETRLDAWIYGIMRNLWIDEIRSRKVHRHDELAKADDVIGVDGQAMAEDRVTLGSVRQAVSEMDADSRTVLVLVCVDGLSYKEAAKVLGIPIGTVMSRLSRSRVQLHEKLFSSASSNAVTPFPQRPGRGQRPA